MGRVYTADPRRTIPLEADEATPCRARIDRKTRACLYFYLQAKFAASSVLPVPLYTATSG